MGDPAGWAGIGPGDRGTPAVDWARWLAGRAPDPAVTVPEGYRRLVVVAPHPDDEILGVGVTASRFAAAGVEVVVLAVTDGDASHPDSPTMSPRRLAGLRVEESRRACALLGLPAGRDVLGAHRGELGPAGAGVPVGGQGQVGAAGADPLAGEGGAAGAVG